MNAVIWSGATNASDIFFLIAAIVAGLAALMALLVHGTVAEPDGRRVIPWPTALIPAAICLVALGLLAV